VGIYTNHFICQTKKEKNLFFSREGGPKGNKLKKLITCNNPINTYISFWSVIIDCGDTTL